VETGRKWPGEDLVAGLELVRLLFGQDFAEEIVKVDVSNFAGRVDVREAQLVLGTKIDTHIRWGRPINSWDFFVEVPTTRKLEYLKLAYQKFGRVDAGKSWIDIRFDKVTYPTDNTTVSGR
jgi:hypothetical protein